MEKHALLFVLVGYLLGSIPFGYIFAKLSGKEIFKVGWRKSSGSNVFRYVGIWQGIATAVCDIAKAFLAVFLAQQFGLSSYFQALCGVAAVVGNNWSCFLRFAGGRGIGAFFGAFLAFSPQLLGLSVAFPILISLIWNASIGTILFLFFAFSFSVYFGQFQTVGILVLASLAPIFIKRLSPVGEIFPISKKLSLIANRIIFDNDQPCFDLRITRLINKLTWW